MKSAATALPRSGARQGPQRRTLAQRIARAGLLLVAPASLYIGVFHVAPVFYAFYLSLTRFNPLERGGPQFLGVENYVKLLSSPHFLNAVLVTVKYTLLVVPPTLVLALALAMLVNRPLPGIAFFRAVLYLPRILSMVVASIIWVWLYSRSGLINYLLDALFGLAPLRFLSSPDMALVSVAAMRIWKALGGNMVLFLAALQTIPSDLYEAAKIDGAGSWALFRHVTLPGIRPTLVYIATINIVFLMQSFAEIFIMTGGGPGRATTTINLILYRRAFQENQMGEAAAMAFVLFALIFGFSFFVIRAMTRRDD